MRIFSEIRNMTRNMTRNMINQVNWVNCYWYYDNRLLDIADLTHSMFDWINNEQVLMK